jgi:hypothetical protein
MGGSTQVASRSIKHPAGNPPLKKTPFHSSDQAVLGGCWGVAFFGAGVKMGGGWKGCIVWYIVSIW